MVHKGADEVTDLAVVEINDGGNLPIAALGDSGSVQVGTGRSQLGNPLGLDNTVTLEIMYLKRSSREVDILDKRLDLYSKNRRGN